MLIFNLLNRDVNEKSRQFQFFAKFVAEWNASIAAAETIYRQSCLSNHVLLAKHICGMCEREERKKNQFPSHNSNLFVLLIRIGSGNVSSKF